MNSVSDGCQCLSLRQGYMNIVSDGRRWRARAAVAGVLNVLAEPLRGRGGAHEAPRSPAKPREATRSHALHACASAKPRQMGGRTRGKAPLRRRSPPSHPPRRWWRRCCAPRRAKTSSSSTCTCAPLGAGQPLCARGARAVPPATATPTAQPTVPRGQNASSAAWEALRARAAREASCAAGARGGCRCAEANSAGVEDVCRAVGPEAGLMFPRRAL